MPFKHTYKCNWYYSMIKRNTYSVVFPSNGTVTEVRVAPDDKVQEGDVVAVLQP